MDLLSHFAAAVDVTGPILLILALGVWLGRSGFLTPEFIAVGNRLVFTLTLPCLLFLGTAARPLEEILHLPLVGFGTVCTLLTVAVLWLLAPRLVAPDKRGVFVQGAFRGNMAIVGLALCVNAYGPAVLGAAGVYAAILILPYNLLSVLILSTTRAGMLPALLRNPLILGVLGGLAWSALGLPLPALLERSGEYFAQMTLPLALLCTGASLDWRSFKANHRDVVWAAMLKLVVIPAAATLAAAAWGFRGQSLGILYLMMAAPTATASYIMARQMTAHGAMAAEIVVLTTALSPVTVTLGLLPLGYFGLI